MGDEKENPSPPEGADIKVSKVPLDKAANFFKSFASDVAVSGPTPDGQVHLTFLTDRISILSLTLEKFEQGNNTYARANYNDDDSEYSKECLGTCSLTASAAFGLIASLVDRAIANQQKDQLRVMLINKGVISNGEADV